MDFINPVTPPNPCLGLRSIIPGIISSKNMWEKLRSKDTICHKKLLKILWENKEKMTYLVNARIYIASLKILWENKEKITYVVHACIDIASLKSYGKIRINSFWVAPSDKTPNEVVSLVIDTDFNITISTRSSQPCCLL
jgi:hypothetical protein